MQSNLHGESPSQRAPASYNADVHLPAFSVIHFLNDRSASRPQPPGGRARQRRQEGERVAASKDGDKGWCPKHGVEFEFGLSKLQAG